MTDFSQFKKIKSTPHLTVLKHPAGHEIQIAHAGLGEDLRKKLQAIPLHLDEGGEVQASQAPTPQMADTPEQIAADAAQNPPQPVAPEESVAHRVGSSIRDVGEPLAKFASQALKGTPAHLGQEFLSGLTGEPASSPEAQGQAQASPKLVSYEQAPQGAAQAQQPETPRYESPYEAQAKVMIDKAKSDQEIDKNFKAQADVINGMRTKIQSYLTQNPVDANRYIHEMGVGQKVASAIGLLLGGFGAGANGGKNIAVDYLNQQIDRDVNAQVADLGQKQNLLTDLTHQFGNLRDATDMFRAISNDRFAAKLQAAATQIQDPVKRLELMSHIGNFQKQGNAYAQQVAYRQGVIGASKQGGIRPEDIIQARIPDEKMQEPYLKELGESRKFVNQRQNFMNVFDELSHINTLGHTAAHPIDTYSANERAKAFLASLSKETEGRVTEADVQFLAGLLPTRGVSAQENAKRRFAAYNYISQKGEFPLLDKIYANPAKETARLQASPNENVRPATGRIQAPLQVNYQPGQGR